jgi:hypothetical protein
MKKEKINTHNEQCFIYSATPENLTMFKKYPHKILSDDKKYILIFNEAIFNEFKEYYEWFFQKQDLGKYSFTDFEYYDLLTDLGIKKPLDLELFKETSSELDESSEIIINFYDSKTPLQSVSCNLKELSSGKALAKIVIVFASYKDILVKSIKEVKPKGYFSISKRGNNQ